MRISQDYLTVQRVNSYKGDGIPQQSNVAFKIDEYSESPNKMLAKFNPFPAPSI